MKASELLKHSPSETLQKVADFKESLRQQQLVRSFERCGRCGGDLSFSYRTNWRSLQVHEEGACISCQEQLPARAYRLQ